MCKVVICIYVKNAIMGDVIILKFQYMGQDVDIIVNDIDKFMLTDLIIEYWEKVEEQKINIPKHPQFPYIHKKDHVNLGNDSDLIKLFSNLPGRDIIYIFVGCLTEDSAIVKIALSLREKQASMKIGSDVPSVKFKDVCVNGASHGMLYHVENGVAFMHEDASYDGIYHIIKETWPDIQLSPIKPINMHDLMMSSSPKTTQTLSQISSTSDVVVRRSTRGYNSVPVLPPSSEIVNLTSKV